MKDVDDYRWISVDDRGAEKAVFTCDSDIALAFSAHCTDLVDDHVQWQWLPTINERSATGTDIPSLPVIQID